MNEPGQRDGHEWHRREAPDTSVAFAYRQAASGDHRVVLALFEEHRELTCKEVAEMMGKPMHSVSGRLTFLARDGVIEDSGERRDGGRVMRLRPEHSWNVPGAVPEDSNQPKQAGLFSDYRSGEAREAQADQESAKRDALARWLLDNVDRGREMWTKWSVPGKGQKPKEWLDDMRERIGREKDRRRAAAGNK